MKALLITFAVLLLLLTLLSTFGGSIRSEPFYQPALEQRVDPREYYYSTNQERRSNDHISENYEASDYPFVSASDASLSEQYTELPSVGQIQMPTDLIQKVEQVGAQIAQAGSQMVPQMPSQMPTQMSQQMPTQMSQQMPTQMPTQMPQQMPQQMPSQTAPIQEGFNIEPFEEEEKMNYAAF